jgi:SRSO17 transposase
VEYFLSNASVETPVGDLPRVGFSRWRIERCFEDGKSEPGL